MCLVQRCDSCVPSVLQAVPAASDGAGRNMAIQKAGASFCSTQQRPQVMLPDSASVTFAFGMSAKQMIEKPSGKYANAQL